MANLSQPEEFVLVHPFGLRIEKALFESDTSAVEGVIVRDMKTGYVWYDLPEARIAGKQSRVQRR